MDYNKYVKQWEKSIMTMGESIQNDNFSNWDTLMENVKSTSERCKKYHDFYSNEHTFGELNALVKENITWLMANDKSFINEYVTMVKENKTIKDLYNFYATLGGFNGTSEARSLVTESLSYFDNGMTKKDIRNATVALKSLMESHEILFDTEQINESTRKFFSDCETLISERKTMTTINNRNKIIESVSNYVNENKKSKAEDGCDINEKISRFAKSYNEGLSEEQKKLFLDVIGNNSNVSALKSLFDESKKQCLSVIENSFEKCDSDELDKLSEIKEKVNNKMFTENTAKDDIREFMKITNILSD